MKYIKSIKISLLIILICFCTFCSGYTMGSSFVYADSTTDNWTQVTTNQQLVEAFRYYCKSRDLTIDGSVANAVTTFTTKTFNGLCNTLGIDVTALQAHLKYETDGNAGIRFLFDQTGITAYNAIFAQFLQDNNLSVGDENVNKNVFNGRSYNGYLLWELTEASSNLTSYNWAKVRVMGSYYIYDTDTLTSMGVGANATFSDFNYSAAIANATNVTVGNVKNIHGLYLNTAVTSPAYNTMINGGYGSNALVRGYPCVAYVTGNVSKIYLYFYSKSTSSGNYRDNVLYKLATLDISSNDNVETNIYITSNVINNNNYEGDTIINNYGTPSDPNNPTPDPGNPELPEPDLEPATDWDIELPDLTVPNWILSGKENKFPFDIPFNVMYALSLLQAEPEAPRVQGTLDFGFTTWDYDLDLSDFDTVAEICRDMEFLAFLTGLMLMTRKLIWG